MRYLFSILFVCFLAACANNAGDKKNTFSDTVTVNMPKKEKEEPGNKDSAGRYISSFNNEALKSKISDSLMKLPFVKKTNSYIDSFSHHTHGMAFMYDSTEDGISVMAGYNGDARFETYYYFSIDPATLAIHIQDESGEMISIKEYIRRQRNNNE